MRQRSIWLVLACLAGLSAASTAQAAPRFAADVVRFHQGVTVSGQTVQIVPVDPALATSLEFTSYARALGARLEALGFRPAPPEGGELVAALRTGSVVRDLPREGQRSPVTVGVGVGVGGGSGGVGVNVGTLFGLGGNREPPRSRTTTVELRLSRATDGVAVWEGRAVHEGRDDKASDPATIVPQLMDGLLADFPGPSGQTVRYKAPRTR